VLSEIVQSERWSVGRLGIRKQRATSPVVAPEVLIEAELALWIEIHAFPSSSVSDHRVSQTLDSREP
jgi:hypothetical protein